MWRPTMLLLCLMAALGGGPLRQAEAAGDLARSLAELDGGDVIEAIDGGVGDDAGESILTPVRRACADPGTELPSIDRSSGFPISSTPSRRPSGDRDSRPPRPGGGFAADPARRAAWLQAFRF